MPAKIVLKGARVHNLKNIDLEIPRDRLIVITGVSGSGKSSLAFDTLYAEGQRRYVESLSPYARQFIELMERPDVESIDGLPPAISIEQRNVSKSPRSTVGTVTEIYDYLRLLFARIGKPYCYKCGKEISAHTIQQIVDWVVRLSQHASIHIFSPIIQGKKGDHRAEVKALAKAGFARVKIDGRIYDLAEEIALKKNQPHDIDLLVDRLTLREGVERRLADSLETAARYGRDVIKLETAPQEGIENGEARVFSLKWACIQCGISYPELTPRMFSFNSPYGACRSCGGLGVEAKAGLMHDDFTDLMDAPACRSCKGARLRDEMLHVKIGGKNIAEVASLPLKEALNLFSKLALTAREEEIGRQLIKEITDRLRFLIEVGLDYLSLDRPSATLSGGEGPRIRLASQMGSGLAGVLYILDEPSIGLHQRDNARLIALLKQLRDLGNTVLVVEHDRETILEADHLIDMGPGAGENGGEVVASGTPAEIAVDNRSLTGRYLSGRMQISIPTRRRKGNGEFLILQGVRQNNLKSVTVRFPIGAMSCVTGVSGSGKSSLVIDTLSRAMAQRLYGSRKKTGRFDEMAGWQHFDRAVSIDQSPIGRTPRSNPATYSGLFDRLRDLFSQLPDARVRGYGPGRFSFNMKGGRCQACAGDGLIRIEMHFLPDVFVTCDVCAGRRYNRETLEILYKGRSIADVLDLTVNQAIEFLAHFPAIADKLETLRDVGLGYIRLGQAATTLSGGEAQRIKLARELSKRSTVRSLYILDEPTTGLHFDDVKKLLEVLSRLTDAGSTVIIIEHNLDVIKSADYILDLGPEGGELGGEVVAYGTPEEVSLVEGSYTGQVLRSVLGERQ